MKFLEKAYLNPQLNIIKFPDHYVALPVTVSNAGVVADGDGRKIVKAGTILGGGTLANPANSVTVKNSAGTTGQAGAAVDAEGVLLTDVDVTYGNAAGALLIHGFVDTTKLPDAPHANAVIALAGRIVFIG